MRHLSLVQDDPAPTEFPPGWADFQDARQRFFARLEALAATAPGDASTGAEPPGEGAAS